MTNTEREKYLPKAITDNIPYALDDTGLLHPLVMAYKELVLGDKCGLYMYSTAGGKAKYDDAKGKYEERAKALQKKIDFLKPLQVGDCEMQVPRKGLEIARKLYKDISFHKLSEEDMIQTVIAVTGYTRLTHHILSTEDKLTANIIAENHKTN